jgi:protease I
MGLKNRKVALLLAQEYQELEVWYPYYRLKEEGVTVTLVAAKAGQTYPSKLGYPCTSDAAAGTLQGGDFDAVVIPGGWSPDFMRREESMIRFVQQAVAAKRILAAICHGGWMLCCTDALKGRRATSFVAIKHDMMNAGAKWVDEECVVDGDLITSRKPDDLPAFCKAILAALA